MRVRAQMSMMFHLDKCIGCHTCSVACKNIWTDRAGAEYMWWNNVETRPGTGYPTGWEDQDHYKGGWKSDDKGKIDLRLQTKTGALANLFFNPALPSSRTTTTRSPTSTRTYSMHLRAMTSQRRCQSHSSRAR